MKKFFSLVLALVMALSLTTVAWGAATIYVDGTNGNDTTGTGAVDAPFATLAKAVESTAETDVTIKVAAGNYTLPVISNKNVTFVGGRNVVFNITAQDSWHTQFPGTSLAFEGVTVNSGANGTARNAGLNAQKVSYTDCAMVGLQYLYAPEVTFTACEFDSTANTVEPHAVWTWGSKNVTFTECEFTYGDRAINVFGEYDVAGGQTVTLEECVFTTNSATSTGAVEINSSLIASGVDVSLDDCTAPAKGELAYVSQWDSTGGANTDVFVDDALVGAVAKVGDVEYKTLAEAVAAGGTIDLLANVTETGIVEINKNVTLNLNGFTYTGLGCYGAIYATGGQVVINGPGKVIGTQCTTGDACNCATTVWASGNAKVTINGGEFGHSVIDSTDDHYDLIYAKGNATIEILGGTFKAQTPDWTLNLKDADRATAKIVAKGGTYYMFDPAHNNTEGADTNYVDGAYAVKHVGDNFEVYKQTNATDATVTTKTDGSTTTVTNVVTKGDAADKIAINVTEANTGAAVDTVVIDDASAAEVFDATTTATTAKPVEIKTDDATVTFDKAAAAKIADNIDDAGAGDLTLTAKVVAADEATAGDVTGNSAAFNEVMSNVDEDKAILLTLDLKVGSTSVFSDGEAAGTATVKVALPAGMNSATVYYLNGSTVENLGACDVVLEGGVYYAIVKLNHFSSYVVASSYTSSGSSSTPGTGSTSSSIVNGTTASVSAGEKYAIYEATTTNKITTATNFIVSSYTGLSTKTVSVNGYVTTSYIPAYYTVKVAKVGGGYDLVKYYESDANCGEFRLFKGDQFVTYLNRLDEAQANGGYTDGDFISDTAVFVAKGKTCGSYKVDTYTINGATAKSVNANGWNVAIINGKVAVYSGLDDSQYIPHDFTDLDVTFKSTTDVTVVGITCDKCDKTFTVVKQGQIPATYIGKTQALSYSGVNYEILLGSPKTTPTIGGTTTGGTVTSADTFDAGIAMYVGMSVLAATGSAVVIGKKKD